jgi:hypothetical protein
MSAVRACIAVRIASFITCDAMLRTAPHWRRTGRP